MSVILRAARVEDLADFELDMRQQRLMPDWLTHLHQLVLMQVAIAAVHRGRVIAIGGITPIWHQRATCWAFISADFPIRAWVPAVRATLRALCAAKVRRIEADVREEFRPARRLVEMLGFAFEGAMPAYWTDGATYLRFARVTA